jgi:Zn-dependent peptidase ImmA (M78 family)
MLSCEETVRAVDEVVRECLEQAGIAGPPVDPVEVADALGLVTQRDAALPGRGERRTIAGRSLILIRPEQRDERECFAIAHEIGEEIAAGRVIDRLGIEHGITRWREELANLFAARLLCPADWLRECLRELGDDLRELKEQFATASHEVIARQMLSLPIPTVITVIDNQRVSSRLSNTHCPPTLCEFERDIWQAAYRTGEDQDLHHGSLRVQAWAIHEADWRREILRTTRLDE